VDAVPVGTRWLPQCLQDLKGYGGVAWSSVPEQAARRFKGWAWHKDGSLPAIPWELGHHGTVHVDLEMTLREALRAAGFETL
jgi:hypothetical protein